MIFNIIDSTNSNTAANHNENDEQIVTLEAFQGDSALIQTVNELQQLKTTDISVL